MLKLHPKMTVLIQLLLESPLVEPLNSMKKLKELRELQALLEQSILSEAEYAEQKAIVLKSLHKLH